VSFSPAIGSTNRFKVAQDRRQQLAAGRMDVHRALHDGVRGFGVHQVENRVHDLVASRSEGSGSV
jgi:hypothetical protein